MKTIAVKLRIRMTKREVERELIPGMKEKAPNDANFYWWNNKLMMQIVVNNEKVDVPCVLTKQDMFVEVVDEKDIYKSPPDDSNCDCPLCSGELSDLLRKIFDD